MEKSEQITQQQFLDIVTGDDVSWQALIYELINTGQLNPWDIDLAALSNGYIEKIKKLEEANFFVSSKVLYAASLLLRLKAEVLLHTYISNLDEILYGKKEEKKQRETEKIELDADLLPGLYPRTPLPRYKKVTIDELMNALQTAMKTETRRIKREISGRQAVKMAEMIMPRGGASIRDKIKSIFSKLRDMFSKKGKVSYTELIGSTKEERVAAFLPLLHLDTRKKVWLEQEKHFDEIWIWLYEHYRKQFPIELNDVEKEIQEEKIAKETGFDNPLADFFNLA